MIGTRGKGIKERRIIEIKITIAGQGKGGKTEVGTWQLFEVIEIVKILIWVIGRKNK